MALEISGKVVQILPEQTGQGQNGNWLKQNFIIQTEEQYPKKVCFVCWNDKAEILKQLNPGDEVKVSFSVESREFNGKWYTDVKAWRIEPSSILNRPSNASPAVDREMSYHDLPPDVKDDLPF